MEDNNQSQINQNRETKFGGYNVENIVLLESHFSRDTSKEFIDLNINNEINLSHQSYNTGSENKFGVISTLDYKGKINDVVVLTSTIKMLGVFEKRGEPALAEDSFKKINAPAIIYPFIREHLFNISLKAGFANLLLPTVNFKVD